MSNKELTTEEWKQQKREQRARFTVLQNLPYEVKIRRQARRAWQYYEEITSRDQNCHVRLASAGVVCTGGAIVVHMVAAMTISEYRRIHTIRLIRTNHQELHGATGISRVSRHTGAEVEYSIQSIAVNTS